MKVTYDPIYNIGYIKFRDKVAEVETLKISDEMNLDITPDGKIYGIELLNANEQLQIEKKEPFTFTDESIDKTLHFSIRD